MPAASAFLHVLPYLASAAISAGVAAYCWVRRSRPGVGAFAVVALAEAFWTAGLVCELLAPGLRGKIFWDNVQFLAIPPIAIGFLAFALGFGGRRLRHSALVHSLLALPLIVLAVLAFTDPLHGLVRRDPRIVAGIPFPQLIYGFTPLVDAIAIYLYAVMLAAFAVLVAGRMRAHPLYRAQVNVVLAGVLIPVAGSVLTVTVLADFAERDLTPITFALGNLVIAWGLFRRRLFDVTPIARHVVVDSLADAVFVLDARGRVVDLNPAARAACADGGDPVGRPAAEVLPLPADAVARLADGAEALEVETTGAVPHPAEVGAHPLAGPRGERWGSVVVMRDVGERRRAQEELRRHRDRLEELVAERTAALRDSEERLRQIAENSSEVFWLVEADGRVAYLSPAFERLWGMPRERVYADPDAVFGPVRPEARASVRAILDEAFGGRPAEVTYRLAAPDGGERWVRTRAVPVYDARGAIYRVAGVTEDVTERRRMEEQLVHDALHDALTGLPNRALFEDRLRHALDLLRRHPDRGFAVMMLDLDRFKRVNDSFGHLAGDRLMEAVALRLRAAMRDGDTVARFGGDEFALLLDGVADAGEALRGAERIQAELARPFDLEGHELVVTPSIGIALGRKGAEHPEELLRKADTAMYRAKERGGSRCEVYDRAMHARALSRLRLETELRHALERGELCAAYQPIVAVGDGQIVGFEALARWRHPERGLLAPGSFIDVAEETGLIVQVDRCVLREACARLREWRQRHPGMEPRMTVNLSARQLAEPGLADGLAATFAETGVEVDWMRLEITENGLVGRAEEAALGELRARGIHLVVDDFGTGYSSLGYLHRLPISALKVDRSFLSGGGEGNLAIVGAVVTLAHGLGMDVVVEGVERPEQLERVRALGADYAQGYLFSPPVEAEAAEALLARRFVGASAARA
ncbi:MAG TPA: EAL domain-containing protein [Longimicrobium sp.]